MNHFSPKETARRYAIGRPYFHEIVMDRVLPKLNLAVDEKFEYGLDVACGTGLSTKALQTIAHKVYGTDIADEMMKYARENTTASILKSRAEKQPFEDHQFDIITVSSGLHWFEIDDFLQECSRLLKKDGFLLVYNNHFLAQLEGIKSFTNWLFESYLKHYPSPSRNNQYEWEREKLINQFGLAYLGEDKFVNTVPFTKAELILYFTTQSNVSAAVEGKGESYKDIENWLTAELANFYAAKKVQLFHFGNTVNLLQKVR
ncbi:MAG: class I SAM-dependent methyltransferase [Bacteroidota bacterium]